MPRALAQRSATSSALAAAAGLVTGWVLATKTRHRDESANPDRQPDDPAWHAALHSSHPPAPN